MAPRSSDSDASRRPTDNDLKFFESYLKNMKSMPEVDWSNVALEMGLAHATSARERFRQIKQKLGWATGPGGAVGPGSTPRKRKSTAVDENEDVQGSPQTPKKRRGRQPKKEKAEVRDVEDADAAAGSVGPVIKPEEIEEDYIIIPDEQEDMSGVV